jgi:ankyrin repeat protein
MAARKRTQPKTGWVGNVWRGRLPEPYRATYPSLRWAIQSGRLEDWQELLANGADPNAIDSSSTPLCMACFHGKVTAVRALLAAGAKTSVKHPRDDFPLVSAVRGKSPKKADLVKMLLAAGADPDPPVGSKTLLEWCAGKKDLADVVALLEAAKKSVASTPKATASPPPKKPRGSKHRTIRDAAQFGSAEDVKQFIDAGWPVDTIDQTSTALGMACFHKKPAIVKLLLDAGADPNLVAGGSSPLMNAVQSRSKRTLEMVQMLLDAGADPNSDGYRDMSLIAWVGRDPKLADVHAALIAAKAQKK